MNLSKEAQRAFQDGYIVFYQPDLKHVRTFGSLREMKILTHVRFLEMRFDWLVNFRDTEYLDYEEQEGGLRSVPFDPIIFHESEAGVIEARVSSKLALFRFYPLDSGELPEVCHQYLDCRL
jgi:hypothetical protein